MQHYTAGNKLLASCVGTCVPCTRAQLSLGHPVHLPPLWHCTSWLSYNAASCIGTCVPCTILNCSPTTQYTPPPEIAHQSSVTMLLAALALTCCHVCLLHHAKLLLNQLVSICPLLPHHTPPQSPPTPCHCTCSFGWRPPQMHSLSSKTVQSLCRQSPHQSWFTAQLQCCQLHGHLCPLHRTELLLNHPVHLPN